MTYSGMDEILESTLEQALHLNLTKLGLQQRVMRKGRYMDGGMSTLAYLIQNVFIVLVSHLVSLRKYKFN